MKTFGETSVRVGFDAAKPKQTPKQLLRKRLFVSLGPEIAHQRLNLFSASPLRQGHKKVGRTEIRVILGDFVFEDEMVPESVPGKFADHAVILMKIVAEMGKDEIR